MGPQGTENGKMNRALDIIKSMEYYIHVNAPRNGEDASKGNFLGCNYAYFNNWTDIFFRTG